MSLCRLTRMRVRTPRVQPRVAHAVKSAETPDEPASSSDGRPALHGRLRPPSAPCARARAPSHQEGGRLLRPVLVRVWECGVPRVPPETLVFLTRRSSIVFAGWASWRNSTRHVLDAGATHENHQFRFAGCRSTANCGCVPGHLLRCAPRCRAPSERGHHRASGAQIE